MVKAGTKKLSRTELFIVFYCFAGAELSREI